MSIKFTDVRSHNGSTTYVCPNECLKVLRSVLEKMTFTPSKGGSIASGGEVPLTVMLPVVAHLKIVDHNYGSLFWTCTKILMLKNLTNTEIRAMFAASTPANMSKFIQFVQDVRKDNPIPLTIDFTKDTRPDIREWHRRHGPTYTLLKGSWSKLCSYWTYEVPDKIMDAARERLDNIEVIHGDLRDLGTNELDVLYISNAMEHTPYDGSKAPAHTYPLREQIAGVMSLSGQLLATGTTDIKNCTIAVTEVDSCCPHAQHMSWSYYLLRTTVPGRRVARRFERYIQQEEKQLYKRVYDPNDFQYSYRHLISRPFQFPRNADGSPFKIQRSL